MTLRDTLESVLDTVKSMLGQDGREHRADTDSDVGVTVEREAEEEPEPVSSPADEREEEVESEATAAESEEADESEAAADEADEDEAAGGSDESPDVLEGIGPTYAERLAAAGIDTVADLAAADAAELAPNIDNVGESTIEDWIQRARER